MIVLEGFRLIKIPIALTEDAIDSKGAAVKERKLKVAQNYEKIRSPTSADDASLMTIR